MPIDHPWRGTFSLGEEEITLAKGKGCTLCSGRGYLGRIAIAEFLNVTPEISLAIQNQANRYEILKIAKEQGFKPMAKDGVAKALLYLTTLDEIEQLQKETM